MLNVYGACPPLIDIVTTVAWPGVMVDGDADIDAESVDWALVRATNAKATRMNARRNMR